jgi:hypothetical protein
MAVISKPASQQAMREALLKLRSCAGPAAAVACGGHQETDSKGNI